MRAATPEELCHDQLGDKFEQGLSHYDTQERLNILTSHFLRALDVRGLKVLDVGCGLGYFSERLTQLGADVTACDIGPNLVATTARRAGCKAVVGDALALSDTFGTDTFDLVISSECIEHTPIPQLAVLEMMRVLKPGGHLSLSTPNLVWYPVVWLATVLKLRPFDGFENFSTFSSLKQAIELGGGRIVETRGLHLFPFQIPLRGLSRWCDGNLQFLRGLMINLCVLARKSQASA